MNYTYWDQRKEFFIGEASTLWVGCDPADYPGSSIPDKARPVRSLLFEALKDGRLKPTEDTRGGNNAIDISTCKVSPDELKKFAESIRERPEFLFKEERGKAENVRLEKGDEACEELKREKESIEKERDLLKTENDKMRVPDQRSERTYQNIIAALLGFIKGETLDGEAHPLYTNETKLIETLVESYKGYDGLSQRTLAAKIPEARENLIKQ